MSKPRPRVKKIFGYWWVVCPHCTNDDVRDTWSEAMYAALWFRRYHYPEGGTCLTWEGP